MASQPEQPSTLYRILAAFATLTLHSILLLVLMFVLLLGVPEYQELFERADLALPEATIQVLLFSEDFARYWYAYLFGVFLVDTAIVLSLTFVSSRRRAWLSVYSHLVLTATIVGLAWLILTLTVPIHEVK